MKLIRRQIPDSPSRYQNRRGRNLEAVRPGTRQENLLVVNGENGHFVMEMTMTVYTSNILYSSFCNYIYHHHYVGVDAAKQKPSSHHFHHCVEC